MTVCQSDMIPDELYQKMRAALTAEIDKEELRARSIYIDSLGGLRTYQNCSEEPVGDATMKGIMSAQLAAAAPLIAMQDRRQEPSIADFMGPGPVDMPQFIEARPNYGQKNRMRQQYSHQGDGAEKNVTYHQLSKKSWSCRHMGYHVSGKGTTKKAAYVDMCRRLKAKRF